MIKTINKGNWTGETATIKINQQKRILSIYDGDYKLKLKTIVKNEVYHVFCNNETEYPFCVVYQDTYNNQPYFHAYNDGIYGINRDSDCIYTAIAQLAFNLI